MHPIAPTITDLFFSKWERQKCLDKLFQLSTLQLYYADFLAGYIKWVFLIGKLFGEGIEPLWTFDSPHSQKITFNKWTAFQNRFMEEWDTYMQEYLCDNFWMENQPAFHAYNYSMNIKIKINKQFQSLPKESHL